MAAKDEMIGDMDERGKEEDDGWTYHAKGMWISFPSTPSSSQAQTQANSDANPSISVIGSSNFTQRSYTLDLEASVVISTESVDLQRRLGEEVANLKSWTRKVDEEEFKREERKVGLGVKFSMWLVKVLGGAL